MRGSTEDVLGALCWNITLLMFFGFFSFNLSPGLYIPHRTTSPSTRSPSPALRTLYSTNYLTVLGGAAIKQQTDLKKVCRRSLEAPQCISVTAQQLQGEALSSVVSPPCPWLFQSVQRPPLRYPELIINWSDSCLVLFIVDRLRQATSPLSSPSYMKDVPRRSSGALDFLWGCFCFFFPAGQCQCRSEGTE